jgi:hypothetical protein
VARRGDILPPLRTPSRHGLQLVRIFFAFVLVFRLYSVTLSGEVSLGSAFSGAPLAEKRPHAQSCSLDRQWLDLAEKPRFIDVFSRKPPFSRRSLTTSSIGLESAPMLPYTPHFMLLLQSIYSSVLNDGRERRIHVPPGTFPKPF